MKRGIEPQDVVPPQPQTVVLDVRPAYAYHTEEIQFNNKMKDGVPIPWVFEMHEYINRFSESMGYELHSCRPTTHESKFLFIWKKK